MSDWRDLDNEDSCVLCGRFANWAESSLCENCQDKEATTTPNIRNETITERKIRNGHSRN